jgi:hypothetical protein
VGVHPRDPAPARSPQANIQRAGCNPTRVIEHHDAVVLRRERLEDLTRAVARTPIDHDELERPVEPLAAHRVHAGANVVLLVEHRHQHRAANVGQFTPSAEPASGESGALQLLLTLAFAGTARAIVRDDGGVSPR